MQDCLRSRGLPSQRTTDWVISVTEIYCLTVLVAEGPKTRQRWSWFLLRPLALAVDSPHLLGLNMFFSVCHNHLQNNYILMYFNRQINHGIRHHPKMTLFCFNYSLRDSISKVSHILRFGTLVLERIGFERRVTRCTPYNNSKERLWLRWNSRGGAGSRCHRG